MTPGANGQRLSAQDAVFLHLEGPNTPYHVASLLIFERGSIDQAYLEQLFRSRLDRVPRLRQKLATVPFNQGRPVWVDDEHLDLNYHVRRLSLPTPGTEAQLLEACAPLMEQHLHRSRPLWEVYLIDGLEHDRGAIFAKTHHAMVDGIAGMDIAALLLDPTPSSDLAEPTEWTPRAPSRARILTDALADKIRLPAQALRGAAGALRHPGRTIARAFDEIEGLGELAWSGLHPAPPSPLNVRIGPNRKLTIARSSLADFKAIKNALGGTVNDVVLAVVTGALREWLHSRGEQIAGVELAAMVPVSLRDTDADGLGNRVSTVIAPLPVGNADIAARYDRIREGTTAAKASHQVVGADLLLQLSGVVPPTLVAQIAKIQNTQRFFNLSVTNIPGPQDALYAGGHRLLDIFPFTPLAGNMALIVAVVSYAGQMEFGLTADAEVVPDLEVIARGIDRSVDELRTLARIPDLALLRETGR